MQWTRSPQGTVFRTPPSRPRARCSKIRGDMYRAAAYQAKQYLAMHEEARASSHASHTHPTNQRGTSPKRPFQNGGGGAPRKATPAQNGPTHPRTQINFSVCLKQIAAIKIANAMAAEYSRAQEISPICEASSSSAASGHPIDLRRGPRH